MTWGIFIDSVIEKIIDDPRRLRMNRFIETDLTIVDHAGIPEGGCVGCVLGLGGRIANIEPSALMVALANHIDNDTTNFRAFARPLFLICTMRSLEQPSGTPEYAAIVINELNEVRDRYRTEMDITEVR